MSLGVSDTQAKGLCSALFLLHADLDVEASTPFSTNMSACMALGFLR